MIMRKVVNFINDSDFPVLGLSFTTSATSFVLKLIAFKQLLDFAPISHYPVLLFIVSAVIFGFEYFMPDFDSYKSSSSYTFYALIVGAALSVMSFHPIFSKIILKKHGYLFSEFVFVAAFVCDYLITKSNKSLVHHTTTALRSLNLNRDSFLAKLSGYVAAALYMFLFGNSRHYAYPMFFSLFPALAGLVMLYYVNQVRSAVEENFSNVCDLESQIEKTTEFSKKSFPFLYLVLSLAFVSTVLYGIHQFVLLVGMFELKQTKNYSAIVIYSVVAMIQGALAVIFYFSHDFFTNKKSWKTHINGNGSFTIPSMIMLFAKLNPFTLVVTGIISEAIHIAHKEESENILMSNMPSYIRKKVEKINATYVSLGATAFVSVLFFLSLNSMIPLKALWFVGAIAAGSLWYFKYELKKNFVDYHVGNIVRGDLYEAIECCHHLSTPDAAQRSAAIISILKQSPRPILAKSLLKTLGEIESPEVVTELIHFYENSKRDDVKIEALKALTKYDSHHISLFLLESLEEVVKGSAFQTESKREIFQIITNRLSGIAVPMLLKILSDNRENFRVVANAIIAVGEIAEYEGDESLYYLLSQYLKPIYSRRIRCNAAIYLYKHSKYKEMASACLSSLLTSENEYDRSAVAYMAGELKIYSMTPFILESSLKYEHKNLTLLISLLKLDYHNAPVWISDILAGCTLEQMPEVLNQICMVKEDGLRFQIYYQFLTDHSDKINMLLEGLSFSQKQFDKDRVTIRNEALKLGCHILSDNKLFLKNGTLFKTVA